MRRRALIGRNVEWFWLGRIMRVPVVRRRMGRRVTSRMVVLSVCPALTGRGPLLRR